MNQDYMKLYYKSKKMLMYFCSIKKYYKDIWDERRTDSVKIKGMCKLNITKVSE